MKDDVREECQGAVVSKKGEEKGRADNTLSSIIIHSWVAED